MDAFPQMFQKTFFIVEQQVTYIEGVDNFLIEKQQNEETLSLNLKLIPYVRKESL